MGALKRVGLVQSSAEQPTAQSSAEQPTLLSVITAAHACLLWATTHHRPQGQVTTVPIEAAEPA